MSTPATPPTSRRQQFIQTYRMAKKTDRTIGLWILGAFVLGAVVGFAVMWFLPGEGVIAWIMAGVGAFLDWGLRKDLLLPLREQAREQRLLIE